MKKIEKQLSMMEALVSRSHHAVAPEIQRRIDYIHNLIEPTEEERLAHIDRVCAGDLLTFSTFYMPQHLFNGVDECHYVIMQNCDKLKRYGTAINNEFDKFVVTGSRGCGKTTTLLNDDVRDLTYGLRTYLGIVAYAEDSVKDLVYAILNRYVDIDLTGSPTLFTERFYHLVDTEGFKKKREYKRFELKSIEVAFTLSNGSVIFPRTIGQPVRGKSKGDPKGRLDKLHYEDIENSSTVRTPERVEKTWARILEGISSDTQVKEKPLVMTLSGNWVYEDAIIDRLHDMGLEKGVKHISIPIINAAGHSNLMFYTDEEAWDKVKKAESPEEYWDNPRMGIMSVFNLEGIKSVRLSELEEKCTKRMLLIDPASGANSRWSNAIGLAYLFTEHDRTWNIGGKEVVQDLNASIETIVNEIRDKKIEVVGVEKAGVQDIFAELLRVKIREDNDLANVQIRMVEQPRNRAARSSHILSKADKLRAFISQINKDSGKNIRFIDELARPLQIQMNKFTKMINPAKNDMVGFDVLDAMSNAIQLEKDINIYPTDNFNRPYTDEEFVEEEEYSNPSYI